MPAPERSVLVTGANSGLGLAAVLEVARRGFRAVGSVRSAAKAEQVREAAERAGLAVETVLLDVADAEQSRRVIDELRPLGIVNNAGYMHYAAFEDALEDEVRALFEVLVIGPMRLARLALPHMRDAGWGRIVNVSSIVGRFSFPMMGWYQAGKQALEAVSDALRMEAASDGIQVVLIQPGSFKTGVIDDIRRGATARGAESRYRAAYERMLFALEKTEPLWGPPERVARVIGDALTAHWPQARYVVGLDAWSNFLTAPLPTRVRDFVMRRMLRL
jgi:NAD(P)-dependent dehydrogenase (short-subunit alcohol dehydrogenase family)